MKPIIFADDEFYFHRRLTKGFNDRLPNVQVEAVWSGDELVDKVLNGDYGVIVTDYKMGNFGRNGLEAAQALRENGINIPIFMYSTNIMPTEVLSRNPLDKAFEKESDFERLLDEVANHYRNQ